MKLLLLKRHLALERFNKLNYKANWKFLDEYPKPLQQMKPLKIEIKEYPSPSKLTDKRRTVPSPFP